MKKVKRQREGAKELDTKKCPAEKSGRATPKVNKLITLARYFGVSIEYFLNETEVKT